MGANDDNSAAGRKGEHTQKASNDMETETKVERPEIVEDDHLEYLDVLRESGVTNMYGAGPYLQREFEIDQKDAHAILSYWMKSFSERHPKK